MNIPEMNLENRGSFTKVNFHDPRFPRPVLFDIYPWDVSEDAEPHAYIEIPKSVHDDIITDPYTLRIPMELHDRVRDAGLIPEVADMEQVAKDLFSLIDLCIKPSDNPA